MPNDEEENANQDEDQVEDETQDEGEQVQSEDSDENDEENNFGIKWWLVKSIILNIKSEFFVKDIEVKQQKC